MGGRTQGSGFGRFGTARGLVDSSGSGFALWERGMGIGIGIGMGVGIGIGICMGVGVGIGMGVGIMVSESKHE